MKSRNPQSIDHTGQTDEVVDDQDNALLSVVIPIRNESQFIRQTMEQLLEQELGSNAVEFIVVDGMSDDGTQSIVNDVISANPELSIRLLENPKRLSSAARNIGLEGARGQYVLIVDGHVYLPTRDVLRRCIELAAENRARVIGRPQRLTPPGLTDMQQMIAAVRASRVGHSVESHIYSQFTGFVSPISVAVMYERELAIEIGGFDESFDAAEDLEFNFRLEQSGVECLISPELEIFYYPRDSLSGLFMQMSRYGLGRARFLRKHPSRFTAETIIPALFVLGSLTLAGLSIWSTFALQLSLVLATIYASIVLYTNRGVLRCFGLRGLAVLPIALVIHYGLGVGFLRGLLRRGSAKTA